VIRVAAVQLAMTADRERNLARTEALVRQAAGQGAALIVLPEIFSAPFVGAEPDIEYFGWAEPADGPSNALVRGLSAELGTTILSPIFEAGAVAGVYHNSTFAFRDGECVHIYRKSHLPFSNGFPEKFYFRPGAAPPSTFAIDGATVGTIICYERHFPELGRVLALQGADIMCVPVACASEPTREVFELELRAHAAFNSMFVVCANRVGLEGTKRYYGSSAIYGPDGTILAQRGDDEGVVAAEIDPALVEQRRRVLPFFRDRRPDLYGALAGDGG
jgi:N-carbamoylputrescine amidase